MMLPDFVLRGTVVLAAAFGVSFAFGRASAAVRHFVWTAVFLALLTLPLAQSLAPRITLAAPALSSAALPAAVPIAAAHTTEASGATPTVRPVAWAATTATYALWLYLAGLLLVAARFVAGAIRTSRLVRRSRAAEYAQALTDTVNRELGTGRRVRTLESASAAVPMTWGTQRPVVLLPEAARHWPGERLRAVILHELVHVRRHDLLAQMAAQAACCLYWFHPLVWLAARRLRKEREGACDDAVLSGGIPPTDYAGYLLELARGLVERRSLADAPAMAECGDLEERVRAVLDRHRNRSPLNGRLAAAVAALAFLFVLPVALVTLHAQAGGGALVGIVQDASRARVPNCEVRVKNLDGKNEEIGKAGAAGEFGFANIPAGRYAIEVRARGFAIGKAQAAVETGRRAETVVTLDVGQVSETLTVRGARPATGSLAPAPSAPASAPQRIPVGGNVQPCRLLSKVDPIYPAGLKQQGIAGTVMVRAAISTTGETLNPQVINTVNPGLAQAALDAVRQWRYHPALLNGQPVEVVTTVTVNFELEQ